MNPAKLERLFKGGVVKQPIDAKDYIYAAPRADLPAKFLNSNIGEIENQYQTGSCVANAACSSLEMIAPETIDLSRMFVYYNARAPYSNLRERDGGAYVRDGYKAIQILGVCLENIWDFIVPNVNLKPSALAYEKAKENTIPSYQRVQDIQGIKSALVQGNAVIFGIPLKNDFFYLRGPLENHDYKATGTDAGGHAMSIVGYDDALDGFIIENSWGTGWGDQGKCLIKYDIFSKYYFDVWTVADVNFKSTEPVKPEPEPEPVKPEPVKPEPEPVKPEPVKPEYTIWDAFKACCRKVFRKK